jgi:hypothetical protein
MTTRAKWITLSGASAVLAGVAFSQSPPFPSGLSFSGSSRFVRSDYTLNDGPDRRISWVSEGANGEDQGVRVPANEPISPPNSLQHRRSFTPGPGITLRGRRCASASIT